MGYLDRKYERTMTVSGTPSKGARGERGSKDVRESVLVLGEQPPLFVDPNRKATLVDLIPGRPLQAGWATAVAGAERIVR